MYTTKLNADKTDGNGTLCISLDLQGQLDCCIKIFSYFYKVFLNKPPGCESRGSWNTIKQSLACNYRNNSNTKKKNGMHACMYVCRERERLYPFECLQEPWQIHPLERYFCLLQYELLLAPSQPLSHQYPIKKYSIKKYEVKECV